jgi:hypothetical protein
LIPARLWIPVGRGNDDRGSLNLTRRRRIASIWSKKNSEKTINESSAGGEIMPRLTLLVVSLLLAIGA